MAVESLAEALEREHHEIDGGVEEYLASPADGQRPTARLTAAMAALRRHIYLEEEFLFPPLREAGLVAPVFVMVREHAQMWTTLDALDAELDSGGSGAAVEAACRQLMSQTAAHNMKEEQILYPQADGVLTAEATADLKAFLESGSTPSGWVCEGRRATVGGPGGE